MAVDDPALDDMGEAVRAFTGLMHSPGLVSLDYADIRAFCLRPDGLKGRAMHGEGQASGPDRGGEGGRGGAAGSHAATRTMTFLRARDRHRRPRFQARGETLQR